MSLSNLEVLPPVRSNVFKHSLLIVGVYIVVGIFMMIAVFLASGTTPKAIHVNYDSIAAASQMEQAWNALKNPEQYPEKNQSQWKLQFETALQFEETNLTEPGEAEFTAQVRATWDQFKISTSPPSNVMFQNVRTNLSSITRVNEKGMFSWAQKSHTFSRQVFGVTVILFLITVLIALYLADGLAIKISTPLRELSAVLKRRPEPGSELTLPKPETLEMRILSQALRQFWERISYFQTLNLDEISAQRNKLEAVLTSVEDAVLVLDNEEKIIHYNSGFSQAMPSARESLISLPWRDLPTASQNYLTLRSALTPQVSPEQTLELQIEKKMRTFAARYRQITDEKKQPIAHLYLLHDITESKQRDLLRAEFIGVLSHELKTPLQSLGIASELLLARKNEFNDKFSDKFNHKFTDDEKMLIETVFEDTNRIKGVVNEFMEVGFPGVHSLRLKMESVAIQKLMLQWMQPVQIMAKERTVKIEADFVSNDLCIRIDRVKFSWAIANLLSNALRVSPEGSTIKVSLRTENHECLIEISDEGPGIPPEIQRKIFEPYFQGASKDGTKTSGFLGLGLTITKDVVEAHQGKIEYFLNQPKGSTFRITLPFVMDAGVE